ncbi:unnamed protein product [Caenorhabditis brenneri]
MESTMTNCGITVSLFDAKLWKEFYPQTEMIVTKKAGRCLFPHLIYKIEGLEPEQLYQVSISLQRVDNIKYKYDKLEWVEAAKGDRPLPVTYKEHPDGARPGSHWMKNVSFAHLKMTNDAVHEDTKLVPVQSMHKYRPVLLIKKVGDFQGVEFTFQLTEFYVVTAYQSQLMIDLKITHNKFASGFRSGKRKTSDESSKSKRNSTSSGSSSSTPSVSPPAPSPPNGSWGSPLTPALFNQNAFPTPPEGTQFPTPQNVFEMTAAAAAAFPYYYHQEAQMGYNVQNMDQWMMENGVTPAKVENPFAQTFQ